MQEQVGDLLVRQRIEQLGHIEQMEKQVREILESGTLEFRSYEVGINAYVRLAQFEDQLIDKILGDPSHQAEPREPPRTRSLTTEERRLAVKVVLESRRGKAREQSDSPPAGLRVM